MFSLVSLAHRRSRADATHPELQTGVPRMKWDLSSWGHGIKCWDSPVIQDGRSRPHRDAVIWSMKATCTHLPGALSPPLPTDWALQADLPIVSQRGYAYSREQAHISPFFDQRIKLSFASEPNRVSSYWGVPHEAEELFLGTNLGGSVTQATEKVSSMPGWAKSPQCDGWQPWEESGWLE